VGSVLSIGAGSVKLSGKNMVLNPIVSSGFRFSLLELDLSGDFMQYTPLKENINSFHFLFFFPSNISTICETSLTICTFLKHICAI
jgi:hypothetical protein